MNDFIKEFNKIKAEIPYTKVAKTFDDLKNSINDRPVILYGARRLAGVVLDLCKDRNIMVDRICDQNVTGFYGEEKIPIIDLAELKNSFSDAIIIVCSHTFNDEICAILTENGFGSKQITPCPFRYPHFESVQTFDRHLEGYAWAYNFFDDKKSKKLVLDVIRLLLLDEALKPNTKSECYYEDDFISFGKDEVFVDGGAYLGDSAENFINKIGDCESGQYSHIYSFEPDILNYEKSTQRLSEHLNVEVIQKGLWGEEKELVFFQNNQKSAASSFEVIPNGSETQVVPVTSLDVFFKDKPKSEWPTFIKLDVEGAEKSALIGATSIIKNVKPKLAICAYHKPEDTYELPRILMEMRDDYKFILRQHKDGYDDTVLYAV